MDPEDGGLRSHVEDVKDLVNPTDSMDNEDRSTCGLPPKRDHASMAVGTIAATRPEATDGFGSMDAYFEVVDASFPEVSGCRPEPHTQKMTNAPAYAISGAAAKDFAHLNTLTFVPDRTVGARTRVAGDIYLHGDENEAMYVAIRGVDLRKYLFQDIVLEDCQANPQACDNERLPGPNNTWATSEAVPKAVQNVPFNSDVFGCIRNVHGYFAEFNRITKKIPERATAATVEQSRLLHLTNNCREPGNYELLLTSEKDGKLLKNHISLDIAFYRTVLADISVDYEKLGTGLRFVGTSVNASGAYEYEDAQPKAFPAQCHIINLMPYIGKAQRLLTPEPRAVQIDAGTIEFSQFSKETNEKSGRASPEGIVYIRVRVDEPAPSGFQDRGFHFERASDGHMVRHNHAQGEDNGWGTLSKKARSGAEIYAPHTYRTYADERRYPFAISAFEVDGRYLGRLKDERIATQAARLYAFEYDYLARLTQYEARLAIQPNGKPDGDTPRVEIRLLDEQCSPQDCVNLVIGNLVLKPGEETQFVLGIGTQPLRDLYVHNAYQAAQKYALTYNHDGHITQLTSHNGLGMVYVRRGEGAAASRYTVDLVSYERAVPLWRGVVEVPDSL